MAKVLHHNGLLKKVCLDGTTTHKHCEEIGDYIVCHDCKQTLGRKCEVFSRIVGYMRPVSAWNKGKQAEWGSRKTFTLPTPKG